MILNEVQQFQMIENSSKTVIITSRSYLNVKIQKKLFRDHPHVGMENVATGYIAMIFHKRSPLRDPFDLM